MKTKKTKLPTCLNWWGSPYRMELYDRAYEVINYRRDFNITEKYIYYNERDQKTIKSIISDIKNSIKK